MTWTALKEEYLETLPPSLREAAVTWLPRLVAFCERQNLQPADLTPRHLEDYHQELLWQPGSQGRLYSGNTVYMALRLARLFLRWAVATGSLPLDPTRDLVLPRPHVARQPLLSAQELQAVMEAPDPSKPIGLRDALYLELLTVYELGIRACLALDLADTPRLGPSERLQAYLREGRPQLLQNPREPALLLSWTGTRMSGALGGVIPMNCGRAAGLEQRVSARQLARSYRAHREANPGSPLLP